MSGNGQFPVLMGLMLKRAGEPDGHIAVWCPYCEQPHYHDAAGGDGPRVPHCVRDPSSPLLDGFSLKIVGLTEARRAVIPDAPLIGFQRLREALNEAADGFRVALLGEILDEGVGQRESVRCKISGATITIAGIRAWCVERPDRLPIEGRGFSGLAASLYGVSPGVAALRIFEAASHDQLDVQAALELQDVINRWAARGSPARPSSTP